MPNPFEFEESPLYKDIMSIVKSGPKDIVKDIKGTLHTRKEDIEVWDITSIDYEDNFAAKTAGRYRISFKIGLGDYQARILPNRANLEFTIKEVTMDNTGNDKKKDGKDVSTRYKAIFDADVNPTTMMSDIDNHDPISLNNSSMVDVKLDLVHRNYEPLRIKTVNGAYSSATPEQIIRSILGGESMKIKVDGKPAIDGVDIVPPENKSPLGHVIFPHGHQIPFVPTYLQEKLSGVYNFGMGTYFRRYNKKNLWFVYPLYDFNRFDKPGKKMAIYLAPQDKFMNLDRSYEVKGDLLKVVATGGRTYKDSADVDQMNEGTGYRMPDARAFAAKPVEVKGGVVRGKRERVNHEVIIEERSDGLNFAPIDPNGSSCNPFHARSKLVGRTLGQFDVVWENCDLSLLYPGMPVKIYYLSQAKVVTTTGTLLFIHGATMRTEKGNSSGYHTQARLSIAVKPRTGSPDLPVKTAVGDNPA